MIKKTSVTNRSKIYFRQYRNSVTITNSLAVIKRPQVVEHPGAEAAPARCSPGKKLFNFVGFSRKWKNIHDLQEVQDPPLTRSVNLPRAADKEQVGHFGLFQFFNFIIRNTINSYYGSFIRNSEKINLCIFFSKIYVGSCFKPRWLVENTTTRLFKQNISLF